MEFWVRLSAAVRLCKYIDKVEKLKLNPEKLDKKGPEHCPRWDDFTEGKHWKFGKTNNFKKYEKLIPKYPPKYYSTKNGKLEVELLRGQESFRINSFVKSNAWALLPHGQSKFKKGQIIDCFLPNHSNKILD